MAQEAAGASGSDSVRSVGWPLGQVEDCPGLLRSGGRRGRGGRASVTVGFTAGGKGGDFARGVIVTRYCNPATVFGGAAVPFSLEVSRAQMAVEQRGSLAVRLVAGGAKIGELTPEDSAPPLPFRNPDLTDRALPLSPASPVSVCSGQAPVPLRDA